MSLQPISRKVKEGVQAVSRAAAAFHFTSSAAIREIAVISSYGVAEPKLRLINGSCWIPGTVNNNLARYQPLAINQLLSSQGELQAGGMEFPEVQILEVQNYVSKLAEQHEEALGAIQAELARVQQELRDEREVRKLAEVELLKAMKGCQGNAGDATEQEPGRARSKNTPTMSGRERSDQAVKTWMDGYHHLSMAVPGGDAPGGRRPPCRAITLGDRARPSMASGTPLPPSPLHWAARAGRRDIVQFFVDSQVELNGIDEGKATPLHLAVENGHLEVVQCLVKGGARMDIPCGRSGKNWPALHIATAKGHVAIVDALLAAGANVNAVASWGQRDRATALHVAIECGRPDIQTGHEMVVSRLIRAGAKLDILRTGIGREEPALHIAAGKGLVAVVNELLAAGADVNVATPTGMTALHVTMSEGVVLSLLGAPGVKVDPVRRMEYTPRGPALETPLHVALKAWPTARWGVARLLLDAGAVITARGGDSRAMEAIVEQPELVDLMLKNRADVRALGPCLVAAAEKKLTIVVDTLLRAGVRGDAARRVHDHDSGVMNEETALYFAVEAQDVALVKRLLAAGADPNAVRTVRRLKGNKCYERETETLLYTAVRTGNVEVAQWLVGAGADIRNLDKLHDACPATPVKPLMDAAKGQPAMLQYLKSLGLGDPTPCKKPRIWLMAVGAMPEPFCR
eukprot:jgi/Mesvir1/27360/Mv07170-RA.1